MPLGKCQEAEHRYQSHTRANFISHGSSLETFGLQLSVCTLIDAWGSVSSEKQDRFQPPMVTNKMPSVSAMAESTQSSFSASPKDVMCHNPQL